MLGYLFSYVDIIEHFMISSEISIQVTRQVGPRCRAKLVQAVRGRGGPGGGGVFVLDLEQ